MVFINPVIDTMVLPQAFGTESADSHQAEKITSRAAAGHPGRLGLHLADGAEREQDAGRSQRLCALNWNLKGNESAKFLAGLLRNSVVQCAALLCTVSSERRAISC